MTDDPIRQVRDAREAYAASLGHDLDAIVADLQARERREDRVLAPRAPRPPAATVQRAA